MGMIITCPDAKSCRGALEWEIWSDFYHVWGEDGMGLNEIDLKHHQKKAFGLLVQEKWATICIPTHFTPNSQNKNSWIVYCHAGHHFCQEIQTSTT